MPNFLKIWRPNFVFSAGEKLVVSILGIDGVLGVWGTLGRLCGFEGFCGFVKRGVSYSLRQPPFPSTKRSPPLRQQVVGQVCRQQAVG